jgi:hypothetical protein
MKSISKNQSEKHAAPAPPPPVLVAHVLHTLPDSLARREEVLSALAALLPPGDENAGRVRALQFHLEEHQRLRFDWPDDPDQA